MRLLKQTTSALIIVASAVILLPGAAAHPTHAQREVMPVWEAANQVRTDLFEAQQLLFEAARLNTPDRHQEAATRAQEAANLYEMQLASTIAAYQEEQDMTIRQALVEAEAAAQHGDTAALADARGRVWTGLLHGAYEITLQATAAGNTDAADEWARLREFRTATRVSLVNNPAAAAIGTLSEGQLAQEAAAAIVGDDLRDAYFFRLRETLNELDTAIADEYPSRAAEWASLVEGYYLIIQDDYRAKQDEEAAAQLAALLTQIRREIQDQNWQAADATLDQIEALVQRYQPVELNAQDIQQKSQLLYIFTDLVYIEYRDGVRNGRITIETEYREAITFREQAEITYQELRPVIEAADPHQAERLGVLLTEMELVMLRYGDSDEVHAQSEEALTIIEATLGDQAAASGDVGLFTATHALLDQLIVAIEQGDYANAEQLRIQAYAVYDFGPELRLLGVAPALVAETDGLFWYGYNGQEGLAAAIARHASPEELEEVLSSLRDILTTSQQVLGEGETSPGAVIFNSAAIVFREGLEAVIILAALLASLIKPEYRTYRRPLVAGSVLAFVATILTWIITRQLLLSLSSWGERLEAVVSLIAIGVLLLITNWFFHKVYWKDWMAQFHRTKGKLLSAETGQMVGLILLGFTSVYREGFETVLFLQALVLDAGTLVVLQGVVVGLLAVAAIGFMTFSLQRKLPYMHMLIGTGMLIGLVLVAMVGSTVRTMQAVGWLPISPIYGFQPPYWAGLWFGVYPTWQGIAAQLAAAVFILGSYYLAENQKKRERMAKTTSVTPELLPQQKAN
jgi:high-affinity iron transporter